MFFFSLMMISLLLPTALHSLSLETFIRDMYLQQKSDSQLKSDYLTLHKSELSVSQAVALEYYMARAYQSFDQVSVAVNHNQRMKEGKFLSLMDFYSAREQAVIHYEKGFALLEPLSEKDMEPELLALKADIISQLCLLKSLGYTMVKGPKVKKLARRVLQKDSGNIRAQMLIASARIYPPGVYGGDAKEGIEILDSIQSGDHLSEEERYNISLGYAYCYARLNNQSKSEEYLGEALSIFPSNVFALAVQQMVSRGTF